MFDRRSFLKLGLGASVAALASRPGEALAATADPVLVVIFLRGGVDPLSVLPPASGTNRTLYDAARPNVRIAAPATLTNGAGFGVHPAMPKLRALYEGGELAFALGAGSVNATRSHFEQLDFIEGGDPVTRRTTGYLNRALAAIPAPGFALQGVAITDEMPFSLRGTSPSLRFPSLDRYGTLQRTGMTPGLPYATRLAEVSTPPTAGVNATAAAIGSTAAVLNGSLVRVQAIIAQNAAVSAAATYGSGTFAANVRDAARIIATEPKVRIVEVDLRGLDTHALQGNDSSGDLKNRLVEIDNALGAFVADAKRLGFWNRTCITVMSEFGRNVAENGSKGTDHGRGGVAFVAGPSTIVSGRRILVPAGFSLQTSALVDGRDLPVTTDLRAIMGEVLTKHLAVTSLTNVFPGFTPTTPGLLV